MAQERRETNDPLILPAEETGAGDEATGALFEPEAAQTVGAKLKAARAAKGVTHAEVFEGTKIKASTLAAIESGDHAALPAVAFTAGFIKAYAQFLGLDPDEYARDWRAEAGAVLSETPPPPVPARPSIEWRAIFPAVRPALDSTEILGDLNRSPDDPAPPPPPAAAMPGRFATWLGAGAALIFIAFVGATALGPRQPSRVELARAAAAPEPTAAAVVEATPKIVEAALLPAAITQPVSDPVETKAEPAVAAPLLDRREAKLSKVEPAPPPQAIERAPAAPEQSAAITAGGSNIGEPAPPEVAIAPALVAPEQSTALAADDPTIVEPAPSPVPVYPAPVATELPVALAAVGLSIDEPPVVAPASIVAATLTRSAAPIYPERCASGAERTEDVAVVFDISAEGRPTSIRLDHASNDCFAEAALETAGRMRFSPRTIDGEPAVETEKRVTVRFVR